MLETKLIPFIMQATFKVADDFDSARAFWSLVGVEADMVEAVAVVDPQFKNGVLQISVAVQGWRDYVPGGHAIVGVREWFFVRVRTDWGGHDSDEGEPTTVGTEATEGVARFWCTRFRVSQSASFSIARLGLEDAFLLAQKWRSRAEYLFPFFLMPMTPGSDTVT